VKAIVRETYGSPDVLHLADVPVPPLGDGDVLVRVRAASANAGDWHLLRGTPFPIRLVAWQRNQITRSDLDTESPSGCPPPRRSRYGATSRRSSR
jgi:hypothetical protein